MATYYSPLSFFKGGKRKSKKDRKSRRKSVKGGFYPSIMTGVVQNGAYLVPAALRQGYKLLKSKTRKNRK
jgi:hypothetical protein